MLKKVGAAQLAGKNMLAAVLFSTAENGRGRVYAACRRANPVLNKIMGVLKAGTL